MILQVAAAMKDRKPDLILTLPWILRVELSNLTEREEVLSTLRL